MCRPLFLTKYTKMSNGEIQRLYCFLLVSFSLLFLQNMVLYHELQQKIIRVEQSINGIEVSHLTIIQNTDTIEVTNGLASWYGPGFDGRKTASGEIYDQNDLTAASTFLPFGTELEVTNLINGNTVTVVINDRGPFNCKAIGDKVIPLFPLEPHPTRILDLSKAAMKSLDGQKQGVIPISYVIQ